MYPAWLLISCVTRRWLTSVFILLLPTGLFALFFFHGIKVVPHETMILHLVPPSDQSAGFNVSRGKWMTSLNGHIAHRRLSDLVIPGTHMSGSFPVEEQITEDKLVWKSKLSTIALNLGMGRLLDSWSVTQEGDLLTQLEAGYRFFDLHVFAMPDGTFVWCDILSRQDVIIGLQQVRDFASSYPQEIIILKISNGINNAQTQEMSIDEKIKFSQVLIEILGDIITPVELGQDPTVQSVISNGRNVMVIFTDDDFIATVHPELFWNSSRNTPIIFELPSQSTKMETLFEISSEKSMQYRTIQSQRLTLLDCHIEVGSDIIFSAFVNSAIFHYACIMVATLGGYVTGLLLYQRAKPMIMCCTHKYRKRGYFATAMVIVCILGTNVFLRILTATAGFGGRFGNLLQLASVANTRGISILDEESRHPLPVIPPFRGVNHMLEFWLARPNTFKVNIVTVGSHKSSDLVHTAILANMGSITRKCAVSFIGNPLFGKKGIWGLFACPSVQLAYLVVSRDEGRVITWDNIPEGGTLTLQEGQFPMDAHLLLCIGSSFGHWYQLFSGNIQTWIDKNMNFYIRASESRTGRGVAYVSTRHDAHAETCRTGIPRDAINVTTWDEHTAAIPRKQKPLTSHPGVTKHLNS